MQGKTLPAPQPEGFFFRVRKGFAPPVLPFVWQARRAGSAALDGGGIGGVFGNVTERPVFSITGLIEAGARHCQAAAHPADGQLQPSLQA